MQDGPKISHVFFFFSLVIPHFPVSWIPPGCFPGCWASVQAKKGASCPGLGSAAPCKLHRSSPSVQWRNQSRERRRRKKVKKDKQGSFPGFWNDRLSKAARRLDSPRGWHFHTHRFHHPCMDPASYYCIVLGEPQPPAWVGIPQRLLPTPSMFGLPFPVTSFRRKKDEPSDCCFPGQKNAWPGDTKPKANHRAMSEGQGVTKNLVHHDQL